MTVQRNPAAKPGRPVTFLIVDDDQVDRMGMKRALNRLKIANPVVEAHDGLEALAMLRGEHPTEAVLSPYIILLDLNMPRMSGLEFLEAVRTDPMLRPAVVFVLTTSDDERDRVAAYSHNVAGYIVKADASATFRDALALIDHYWRVVELPDA